ncbi:MAG: aminotransferase class IV [Actinomycetota bacterium]
MPLADVFDVISHTPGWAAHRVHNRNLALRIGDEWLTPPAEVGLLPGVLREELLEDGRLREADLKVSDLEHASEDAFLNSLRLAPREPGGVQPSPGAPVGWGPCSTSCSSPRESRRTPATPSGWWPARERRCTSWNRSGSS